ncbi:3-hydroxypropanoate dehydrogenase [Panacagrimonas perspica]|uniref:3-hydroxypropanoate dehydrogenase n=1 Tax=Panacagrimonas perspica TaxID=381431 RepID=A0A4V3URJ1_9GAMM|nr:malonic semialdehyde reductase [Panacagrimonas perspica]TDU31705.1 3-hydroxypropanoate dehydrogenase [Panacagrimonas perspica]THD03081.1 malonic semialdehyde reductase [Panacagrimonas perspica]
MTAARPDLLSALFVDARTTHRFLPETIGDALIHRIYDALRLGPTGFNAQPARYLFIRSAEAKAKLAPALSSGNRDKTLAAPLNVVIAWDSRFHEHLTTQFPSYDARGFFEKSPEWIEPTARTNATLQAAYLFLAARALGLGVGPMSGFKPELIDQAFFPDGRWRALLLANLGFAEESPITPRGPRLSFDDAARIL